MTEPKQQPVDDVAVEEAAEQQTPVDAAQSAPGGLGAEEPTVGMGTSLAIGCIAGTIFIVIIALLVLAAQAFI